MATVILDMGSGNTCQNRKEYIKEMYDQLKAIDTKAHEVIVKWQLFERAGANVPLTHECFNYAYEYGNELGYQVTSSVNDKMSLDFLLSHKVPFVKIKNDRSLEYLIKYIPKDVPVYISKSGPLWLPERKKNIEEFWCISRYPATVDEYENLLLKNLCNISDHTKDFTLFYKYFPKMIEWHYKLSYSVGLDSGEFARTPEQLSAIL